MIATSDVFQLRIAWQTKLLLLAMLEESDWQPECVPCVARLAFKTGLAANVVEKRIAELRTAGALVAVAWGQNGAQSRLRVELTVLPKQPPYRGARACR